MVRMDMERRCDQCGSRMGDHRLGRDDFACPEPPRSGLEYKVVELNPQYAEAKLNDLATTGWELVGIGGRFGEFAYMKRPLFGG